MSLWKVWKIKRTIKGVGKLGPFSYLYKDKYYKMDPYLLYSNPLNMILLFFSHYTLLLVTLIMKVTLLYRAYRLELL